MLKISSILHFIHKGVAAHDPRYVIKGYEHVNDTTTGITLHVYDDWFKFTYDDENVVVKEDFTPEEQAIIWEIKKLITPAEVLKERQDNYKPLQLARRRRLSDMYEKPAPKKMEAPIVEEGTEEYLG